MREGNKTIFLRLKAYMLVFVMTGMMFFGNCETVHAKQSIYDTYDLRLNMSEVTIYTRKDAVYFYPTVSYSPKSDYTQQAYQKATEKINNELVWTSNDPSIVGLDDRYDADNQLITSASYTGPGVRVYGLSEGTTTVTVKSALLGKTCKCKVTVKYAELTSSDQVFYAGNTYQFSMKGNAAAVNFSSSDPAIATIDEQTGNVTTLKKGKCQLSCVADDGRTYNYELKVQTPSLNYTSLTTYYYKGFQSGSYTNFPLVAMGVDVKNWTSSNKKVCKVEKHGNLGIIMTTGTGKCTITCTAKNGKKYKCKLTVVGGRNWGGLRNGYLPKVSEMKKHGYYKDINTIKDYGNVIVCLYDFGGEMNWKNGNKELNTDQLYMQRDILRSRYPGREIGMGGNDLLLCKSQNGKQFGRISVTYYYVK